MYSRAIDSETPVVPDVRKRFGNYSGFVARKHLDAGRRAGSRGSKLISAFGESRPPRRFSTSAKCPLRRKLFAYREIQFACSRPRRPEAGCATAPSFSLLPSPPPFLPTAIPFSPPPTRARGQGQVQPCARAPLHAYAIATAMGTTAAMHTRYRSAFLRGMSTRYRTLIEERRVHNYAPASPRRARKIPLCGRSGPPSPTPRGTIGPQRALRRIVIEHPSLPDRTHECRIDQGKGGRNLSCQSRMSYLKLSGGKKFPWISEDGHLNGYSKRQRAFLLVPLESGDCSRVENRPNFHPTTMTTIRKETGKDIRMRRSRLRRGDATLFLSASNGSPGERR